MVTRLAAYSSVDAARLPVEHVYELVGSGPRGLTTDEAQKRLTTFGKNVLQEVKGTPLIYKFLANFVHLMALMLWAAGALAFVAQMPQLGVAVWAVILINAVFSFWQEYKAEKATEALKKLLPSYARVLRDGVEVRVLAEEIVPGDVLLLAEGDNISADGRFVEEFEVRTNNSTLTGESAPVRKTAGTVDDETTTVLEMRNLAFAGTSIASGTGKVVVVSTGMDTQFGKIANLTQSVHAEMSPLQKEMMRITRLITFIAVSVGTIFFLLGALVAKLQPYAAFLFAIGIVAALVPEGLLPEVTLVLAMGVQRMAKRNALIKKLSSVETLGSTSVICTDKTGTLTQNAMNVRETWMAGGRISVTGNGYEPVGQFISSANKPVDPCRGDPAELLRAAMLCNNARLVRPNGDNSEWRILGDPTEAALVVAAAKAGITPESEAAHYPRVFELPFESRRKRMSTIHQQGRQHIAFVKGAPSEVLQCCTHILVDGQTQPMTDALLKRINAANDEYARGTLRVLAVARRVFDVRPATFDVPTVEQDLTFLGLVAMMDPPRPEVAEAVERCRRAGIRTVMITGDYGLTAESIARRIGLVQNKSLRIVTGSDLEAMNAEELYAAIGDEVIFARVSPEHKLRIVEAFQSQGHVVAVTGDGVNDAPALKKADIGVAMGISGTDVAKEAAEMILTDDNFASIVNAIEEGRGVFGSIKKFVTYVLASNVMELVPFVAMVIFNIPIALTVMQVLAIDLGTDMLPALALGTEAPEPGMMERPPRTQNKHLLDFPLLARAYLWLGLLESALGFVGFFVALSTAGYAVSSLYVACSTLSGAVATMCLNNGVNGLIRVDLLPYDVRLTTATGRAYLLAVTVFNMGVIAAQMGNTFACRTERRSVFFEQGFKAGLRWLVSNRLLLIGVGVAFLLINTLVYVQPFQTIFEHDAVSPLWWLFIIWYAPAIFLLEEARKSMMRRRDRRQQAQAGIAVIAPESGHITEGIKP